MRIETDRRYRAIVVGLLLVFVASLSWYTLTFHQTDPDSFWHISAGRYMLSHHSIPNTDLFSWYGIEHHLSWMPQSWLFELGAAAVWLLGGFRLLYIVTTLVMVVVVSLVYLLVVRRSRSRALALLIAALCIFGVLQSVGPRPQIVTYVLLVGLALLLENEHWWWSVPIVLLGVNVHGPVYPLYLSVVAYYTLPKRWPVFVTCAATVLATPAGLALIPYPFLSLMGDGPSVIQEFAPVAPISWPAYLIALLAIVLLLNRRALRPRDRVGLVILIVLSLAALRHMVFLFVLALPLVAPYLELPWQRLARIASGRDVPSTAETPGQHAAPSRASATRLIGRLDLLLVVVLGAGAVAMTVRAATQPFDVYWGYPQQAAQYLRTNNITRYLNEWGDGGFLIFEGMNPLIDGRGEPFFPYPGRENVTLGPEFMSVWQLKTDIRPFLDKYGITHLMLRRSSRLARVLEQSPEFRSVFSEGEFVVYERLASALPSQ